MSPAPVAWPPRVASSPRPPRPPCPPGRASARRARAPSVPSKSWQSVDRHRVLLGDVRLEEPVALFLREPGEPLRALALVRHQWHAVTARVGDPLDADDDRRTRALEA